MFQMIPVSQCCSDVLFSLLEEILCYIHTVARCVEENTDKPTGKFWRALLNKAYDVLDKVSLPQRRKDVYSTQS